MGLQIQFIDTDRRTGTRRQLGPEGVKRFELREEGGDWIAPEVNLAPLRELPVVVRVEFVVTGTPDVVSTRLRAAYPTRKFPKPVSLSETEAVAGGRMANPNPLPRNVQCELRVDVVYRDADARGNPTGPERTVTDTCQLFTGAGSERAPELTVRTPELSALVGQPTVQTLAVKHARQGSIPSLRVLHQETLVAPDDPILDRVRPNLPGLRKAVAEAFSAAPNRVEVGTAAEEWTFPVSVRLGVAEKTVLSTLGSELSIPCAAVLEGARPVKWLLRLEAPGHIFPGWVVIDFGTTNSTVTVHDIQNSVPFLGLPEEQEQKLRKGWVDWLRLEAAAALPPTGQRFEQDWKKLRLQTARALNIPEDLSGWLAADAGQGLYTLIAHLEAALRLYAEPFRRAVSVRLSALASAALRVPTLARFQLFPMKIDLDKKQEEVASDLEILDIEARQQAEDRWPVIRMGKQAAQGRLNAISKAEGVPLERVLERFHPSPKRYFGTEREAFSVQLDGRVETITYDQLMRAGWGKLLEFARRAADDGGFSEGAFRRAVITYPTVAPPSVRQTIQRLLRDLRIADVQTDYDEAVASAIFYVMREYSTYPELGLESFKARTRLRDSAGNPVQNVLVFDIGGGTTDVALLSLTLSEEAVFAAGEDRGAGGRYYKLTPKLLRATGHMQLGGELMTLRLFLLLKAMIADRLLTLVQEKKLTCAPIQSILDMALPELAKNTATNRYQPSWLRESIERGNPDSRAGRLTDALNLAELVVPTRWGEGDDKRAARLQTFYGLWELAEAAKIQLCSKLRKGDEPGSNPRGVDDEALRAPFLVRAEQIRELLLPHYESLSLTAGASLEVRLTQQQAEAAIGKVVEEAVRIALGALESLPKGEMVDWLILSGQSCNLVLVDREIRERFKESNKFIWNPERVTFLPQFAKLSTSLGACYAENQRRYRTPPAANKKNLRRGTNSLYFDVNNLFSYLPCSILQQIDSGATPEVFRAGIPLMDLYGFDGEDQQRALARTQEWEQPPLNHKFLRQDYDRGAKTFWCGFDGKQMAVDIGLTPAQWQDQVRVKCEIDHRLNVELLAFRTDAAHQKPDYALTGRESAPLDISAALGKVIERIRQREQQKQPAEAVPAVALPGLFDEAGKLGWRIGVGDGTQARQWLFEPGQQLDTLFHPLAGTGKPARACLSRDCVEGFAEEGTLVVWATLPNARNQVALGKIERPGDAPNFQRHYRFSLDERGHLRAHSGEPGYWESEDRHCLVREPGRVYRCRTAPAKRDADEERNPFTGKH